MTKPILIVEDDRDIRENLQEVLELEGYTVLTASHGREALDLLRDRNPLLGLILLDWMMPVMDGRTFLSAFQSELPGTAAVTPVALFTAIGEQLPPETIVTATLRKPIDLEVLIRVVGEHCGLNA